MKTFACLSQKAKACSHVIDVTSGNFTCTYNNNASSQRVDHHGLVGTTFYQLDWQESYDANKFKININLTYDNTYIYVYFFNLFIYFYNDGGGGGLNDYVYKY